MDDLGFFRIPAFVAMTAFATTDVAVDKESKGSGDDEGKEAKKAPPIFRGAFFTHLQGHKPFWRLFFG